LIPTHPKEGVSGNSTGEGVSKAKFFKEKYDDTGISEGSGGTSYNY